MNWYTHLKIILYIISNINKIVYLYLPVLSKIHPISYKGQALSFSSIIVYFPPPTGIQHKAGETNFSFFITYGSPVLNCKKINININILNIYYS